MRKTKIVCTLGPACIDEFVLESMFKEGMDVARINFSHGSLDEQKEKIDLVKKVREKLKLPIAIMLDTKGPEYRIGLFENGQIELKAGEEFIFTTEDIIGNEKMVSVSYKDIINNIEKGDTILVNNGLVSFEVKSKNATQVCCKVINGGVLSNKKSMNFPRKVMTRDFLSEQDKIDLLFGIENDVDFVAASFVSSKEDVKVMRDFLDKNGGSQIEIIAKIENSSGVENIDKILDIADGAMVARGDLGVEIPAMEVPYIQKFIIKKCRILGKIVITATEMLESMIYNSRPTRAEVSDVANAVYDGTSAVMLSGETAAGKYPVEAVRYMSQITEYTEKKIDYEKKFKKSDFIIKSNQDAVSHATCSMAVDVGAKCIVANSITGRTVRLVSRFRCPVNIVGMTTSKKVWRKINLSFAVKPVLCEKYQSIENMFEKNISISKKELGLSSGDNIVLTGGVINGLTGNTDLIKLEKIK